MCKFVFQFFSLYKMFNITLDPNLDPNWAKIQDPDANSMYLDPQRCLRPKKDICLFRIMMKNIYSILKWY